MADWVGTVKEKQIVYGPFSGSGLWTARVWPASNTDTATPSIGNFVPSAGSAILSTTVIQFDVTDNMSLFRRILVTARFPNGSHEVVHNGDTFTATYNSGDNTRSVIAGGYRYTVRRNGGWTIGSNPTFFIYAIDFAGNEAP